jgi:hypothetical protein
MGSSQRPNNCDHWHGPRHEDSGARPKGIAFFVHQRMPCSAFLAWIANSMRHVVARWQGAIVAVDKEIQSEFRSTFHGDKHSLLSDDSSFSKSKRYIWAMQVYKVFEKKLGETISVWEEFEAKSLHKLDERQLDNHKDTLFCLFRALFVPLWLLLVGIELVMLLVYLQLPSGTRRRTPIGVLENGFPEPSVWKMALQKLGFSEEPKNELSIDVRRMLRRWHGEYVGNKEELRRHQRMQSLQHGGSYYMRRSDIDTKQNRGG